MPKLQFNDHILELQPGATLFEHAERAEIKLPHTCQQRGSCHECLVRVLEGAAALSPPTASERFLRQDFRLACQARIEREDLEIRVHAPRRGAPQIAAEGKTRDCALDPCVTRGAGDWILLDGEPVWQSRGPICGVAVDIGTTTVVARLVDLESGELRATHSFENPQTFGGPDVMGRISYDGETGNHELQRVLTAYLNHSIGEMAEQAGIAREDIYEVVAAGNATMRDLFFGLDVQGIGRRPFQSLTEREWREGRRATTALAQHPARLGLRINNRGRVYGPPLIACHVGADTSACLAAIELDREERTIVMMDIGTNTELVLGNRERILCASCPAGPAFEGGQIACGMPGLEGAIEALRINGHGVEYRTIGGGRPAGICGSGLIDAMGELLRTGGMNMLGRIAAADGRFWIDRAHGLYLGDPDLSNLAQAKGANITGIVLLARRFGIALDQIDTFYLAGGFARFINIEQAMRIGMIPHLPAEKYDKIGNAAMEGATAMLRSRAMRERIERLVKRIEHVELEQDPDFFGAFIEGIQFKSSAEMLENLAWK